MTPKEAAQRALALAQKYPVIVAIVTALLLLRLIGAAWNWVLTPTVNPHPKDLITLHGTFPFDKGYDLRPRQSTVTTTHWVNRICGLFVRDTGIPCHSRMVDVPLRRVGTNQYELDFYRDYYLPGIAGWRHAGLGYETRATGSMQRVPTKGFPNRTTEVRCAMLTVFVCIEANSTGPNIYDPSVHKAEINFRLEEPRGSGSKREQ